VRHLSQENFDDAVREFQQTIGALDELLEHTGIVLSWFLEYATKHNLPLEESMGFHISRIRALLDSMGNPASPRIRKMIQSALSDSSPREDATVYPPGGVGSTCDQAGGTITPQSCRSGMVASAHTQPRTMISAATADATKVALL
jgi:hypothetical protein